MPLQTFGAKHQASPCYVSRNPGIRSDHEVAKGSKTKESRKEALQGNNIGTATPLNTYLVLNRLK